MDKSTLLFITLIEIFYLIYMFFFFETTLHIGPSLLETQMNSRWLTIHHTYSYENKICPLGKGLVIVAIFLAYLRYTSTTSTTNINITVDIVALLLAWLMNMNALVYLIPIVLMEYIILFF